MNNHSESGTKPENPACQQWGLKCAITPCFGARLVQEGNRLHFSLTAQDLAGHLPSMLQCALTRHFR